MTRKELIERLSANGYELSSARLVRQKTTTYKAHRKGFNSGTEMAKEGDSILLGRHKDKEPRNWFAMCNAFYAEVRQ